MVVNIRTNQRVLAKDIPLTSIYKLLLSQGTDYNRLDQSQIICYQFRKKTCYISKVSKFYVEKG